MDGTEGRLFLAVGTPSSQPAKTFAIPEDPRDPLNAAYGQHVSAGSGSNALPLGHSGRSDAQQLL
eukprot:SAG31_NODE_34858_length_328_cov_1.100437_1_plen_64_part_01